MIPLRDSVPARRPPVVMWGILATCLLVFLYELGLTEPELAWLFRTFGVVPARLLGPEPPYFTLVTSLFLHGGWVHLLGNMLYLWIFGNNVEDAMGHGRFAVFYLLCGFAAAAVQVAFQPDSPVPMVGASGAIAGVLGAYLVLFPHARILALVPLGFFTQLTEVPAVLFLPCGSCCSCCTAWPPSGCRRSWAAGSPSGPMWAGSWRACCWCGCSSPAAGGGDRWKGGGEKGTMGSGLDHPKNRAAIFGDPGAPPREGFFRDTLLAQEGWAPS
jgi:membrane associated rhomboid family serine protease